MTRAETLIRELSARHGNVDPSFLAAVHPLVAKILDAATPAAARVPLLELLAETFERDANIRRDLAAARAGLAQWLDDLRRLLSD